MHNQALLRWLSSSLVFGFILCFFTQAFAYKPEMHIQTANVAIYDALDGGICLDGLTRPFALGMDQKPAQVMLGNTNLQGFIVSFDDSGTPTTKYRTSLLQYAPYIRAGAIGPDAYPDPVTGQLFIHVNTSEKNDLDNGPLDTRIKKTEPKPDPNKEPSTIDTIVRGFVVAFNFFKIVKSDIERRLEKTELVKLFDIVKGARNSVDGKLLAPMRRLVSIVGAAPPWRSVDWGHEVLWRARNWKKDLGSDLAAPARAAWIQNLEAEFGPQYQSFVQEEQRAAEAFALGYFMHMIGDGHIHTEINEMVGAPWDYFSTLGNNRDQFLKLQWMSEEFRHMATEKFLNDHFFPGSEPVAGRREKIDGGACAPAVSRDDVVNSCIPAQNLILPPVACGVCNPLRGVDPSQVSARCDHCFPRCNPWKELCTPELDLSMTDCGERDVCQELVFDGKDEFSLNGLSAQAAYEKCAAVQPFSQQRACRSAVTSTCNDNKVSCICQKGVAVLENVGILKEDGSDRQFTCLDSDFLGGLTTAKERLEQDALADAQSGTLERDLAKLGSFEAAEISKAYLDNITERGCDPRPLDWKYAFGRGGAEASVGGEVTITLENGDTVNLNLFGPEGYDLNVNGEPDLINQCILLNCTLSPDTCPMRALDRDLDELRFTDILTCDEGFSDEAKIRNNDIQDGEFIGLGRGSRASCDLALQSDRSLRVDPNAVLGQKAKPVEAFLNSTFIQTPKNFVSQIMYMDRQYTSITGPDAPKPGELGTYSLGGPLVNGIHAMSDTLKLLSSIERAVLGDPISFITRNDPNHPIVIFLRDIDKVRDFIIASLSDISAKLQAIAPREIIIKNPFTGNVVFKFNPRAELQQTFAILIQTVRLTFSQLTKTSFGPSTIGVMLERRIDLLEMHLRDNWIESVSCAAEYIGTGAHRNYMITKIKEFITGSLAILKYAGVPCSSVGGDRYCEAGCRPPKIVKDVLAGNLQFKWYDRIIDDVAQTQNWISCKVDEYLHVSVFEQLIINPLTIMLEKTTEELLCTTLLGELSDEIRDSTSNQKDLLTVCQQVNHILWHPSEAIDPAASATLQTILTELYNANISIEDTQGNKINMADFVRDLRLLISGSCWDGGLTINHSSSRDMLRAAYGDPRAVNATRTDPNDPNTTQYSWLCPDNRLAEVFTLDATEKLDQAKLVALEKDVPDMVKTLEQRMLGPGSDPYTTQGDPVLMYDPVTKTLEETRFFEKGNVPESYSPIRLLDSSYFLPVYNTIQINKLAFMGPGDKRLKCEADLSSAYCQANLKRCQDVAIDCGYQPDEDHEVDQKNGIRALIAYSNQVPVGSGRFERSPDAMYSDADKEMLKSDTNQDADLEAFFESQYAKSTAPADPSLYQRTCQELGWNLLCDSVYSLDDPDDFARQAHGWSYDYQTNLPSPDPYIAGFPDYLGAYYTSSSSLTQINNDETSGCFFSAYDAHPPEWLKNSLEPGKVPEADRYYPRADAVRYICNVSETYMGPLALPGGVWDAYNHSIGYTPHQRGFRIETARRAFYMKEDQEKHQEIELTRFSLANKGSHVSRLYTKVFMPYHCPKQPDGADIDCDGIPDACDNCLNWPNSQQVRRPGEFGGAVCDGDREKPNPDPPRCFGDSQGEDMGSDTSDMGTSAQNDMDNTGPRTPGNLGCKGCSSTGSNHPPLAGWLLTCLGLLWLRRRKKRL